MSDLSADRPSDGAAATTEILLLLLILQKPQQNRMSTPKAI
jgi:hypothetical protein